MIPMNLPGKPTHDTDPVAGIRGESGNGDLGGGLKFEYASQDCLIVSTPRRLAIESVIVKVGCIIFLYMILFAVLSGSRYLAEDTLPGVFLKAQTNFWVVIILLAPLALVVLLLSDLRLIIEGRTVTFDKTRNAVLLNRRLLASLSDISRVRIKDEHSRGGIGYHLIVEFRVRRAFELNRSSTLELYNLRYFAKSIADFLEVPFEETKA